MERPIGPDPLEDLPHECDGTCNRRYHDSFMSQCEDCGGIFCDPCMDDHEAEGHTNEDEGDYDE